MARTNPPGRPVSHLGGEFSSPSEPCDDSLRGDPEPLPDP